MGSAATASAKKPAKKAAKKVAKKKVVAKKVAKKPAVKPVKKAAKPVAKKSKATAKKAIKKQVAKAVEKIAKQAVQYETVLVSKKTGEPVTERYAKANPELVKKIKKAVSPMDKSVKGVASIPSEFEDVQMVDGQSLSTYLVVARHKDDPQNNFVAVRYCRRYRVHAFPSFADNGMVADLYKQGLVREPTSRRGAYQTVHVSGSTFEQFLNDLSQHNSHQMLKAEVRKSRLHI